jgi:ADP-heptose:LPS heptosyltransferase
VDLLVIRPGALGDTLMTAPALSFLRGRCRTGFAGRAPGLFFLQTLVDSCLNMESGPWVQLFVDDPAPERAPRMRPARIVAFFSDPEGRIRRNLIRCFPGASVSVYPSLPQPGENVHAALHVCRCLEDAGLPVDPEEAFHRAGTQPLLAFSDPRPPSASGRVLCHPGSGGAKKNYGVSFWDDLIRDMARGAWGGYLPTVLLGPAEAHLAPQARVWEQDMGARVIVEPSPLNLMELMASAALYLGHDTGPTHLAALSGVPAIALFKIGDPLLWRPLGPHVRVMTLPAGPSGQVPAVRDAAVDLLGRYSLGSF